MSLENIASSEIRKINQDIDRAIKKGARTAGQVMDLTGYNWGYLAAKGIYGRDIKARIVRKAIAEALETAESVADVMRTTGYDWMTIKKYSKGLKLPRGKVGRRQKVIDYDTISKKIEDVLYEGGAESIQEICKTIHERYDDVRVTANVRKLVLPDGRGRPKGMIKETPRNPVIDALILKRLSLAEMARRAGKKYPNSIRYYLNRTGQFEDWRRERYEK